MSGTIYATPKSFTTTTGPGRSEWIWRYKRQQSKAHLFKESDVQGESVCVPEINLVGHSLTDLCRGGDGVQLKTDGAVVQQSHRHLNGLLGLRRLSVRRRIMIIDIGSRKQSHNSVLQLIWGVLLKRSNNKTQRWFSVSTCCSITQGNSFLSPLAMIRCRRLAQYSL